jgi:hypothetical protein
MGVHVRELDFVRFPTTRLHFDYDFISDKFPMTSTLRKNRANEGAVVTCLPELYYIA